MPVPVVASRFSRFTPWVLGGATLIGVTLTMSTWGSSADFSVPALPVAASTQGGLTLEESSSGNTCTSTPEGASTLPAGGCAAINRLGGGAEMLPGKTVTTTVDLRNVGSIAIGTLAFATEGVCTQNRVPGTVSGSATDLCARIDVVITAGGRQVFRGTAADLGSDRVPTAVTTRKLRPGEATSVRFSATLDNTCSNDYQGLGATLPIRWNFAA